MDLESEKRMRKYLKKEKAATRLRKKAINKDTLCSICGKKYYDHIDYNSINMHNRQAVHLGLKPWVSIREYDKMQRRNHGK